MHTSFSSSICAAFVFCFAGTSIATTGCMPIKATTMQPLTVLSAPQPNLDRLVVGAIPPAATSLASLQTMTTSGYNYIATTSMMTQNRDVDRSFDDFVLGIQKSNIGRTTIKSPVNNVTENELLAAARDAGAQYMVTSQIVRIEQQDGMNGNFAWVLPLSITLIGAISLGVAHYQTYQCNTVIAVGVWNVAEGRRIFNKEIFGEGWAGDTDSAKGKLRGSEAANKLAQNDAYAKALPEVVSFLKSIQ
jgi:hypothetical protein